MLTAPDLAASSDAMNPALGEYRCCDRFLPLYHGVSVGSSDGMVPWATSTSELHSLHTPPIQIKTQSLTVVSLTLNPQRLNTSPIQWSVSIYSKAITYLIAFSISLIAYGKQNQYGPPGASESTCELCLSPSCTQLM
jgi:hypothetical protein